MKIRKTVIDDLDICMKIYEAAVIFQKKTGNVNQWIDGYPSKKDIEADIHDGVSYVLEREGKIVGVMALIEGEDPTYSHIYEGQWLDDSPYATIHRIAGLEGHGGVSKDFIDFAVEKYGNIRIDTHEDNKIMLRVLEKNGFIYCGKITTHNGSERLAYQKKI